MCGIAGFIGEGGPEDLERMTAAIIHRGPDDHGLWWDPALGIYLGHRRLSIIDVESGQQPMATPDGRLVVIYNGEIYNHAELRVDLEAHGYRFRSDHSDTEVLLHGYLHWGEDLPAKLNGMWAFALFDRAAGRLFLSRDRFGKKPLFYYSSKNFFAFASELSALTRHNAVPARISTKSLQKYFAYGYIPAPASIYKNIHKLPGGANLMLSTANTRFSINKYWEFQLSPFENIPARPVQLWGEELRDLLFKSVRRRMIADVPLGIFLSGGMDSSSIAAFAGQADPSNRIRSFAIGFEEKSFDESAYSREAARFLKTDHYLNTLSLDRTRALLPELAGMLDEPMGDSSFLPTYLLCRETRRHVKVALGGDGADELFAGYDPFHAIRLAGFYSKIVPRPVHEGIRMLVARMPVSHKNMSFDFKLKRTLRGLSYPRPLWNPIWLGPLSPAELEEIFSAPFDVEDIYSEAIEQWEAGQNLNMIDRTLMFYTRFYLQDDILVKVDRASMLNSLEVRTPYLDVDLVDFVRKIPSAYKLRRGQTKYILKKALEPILSQSILTRAKKGFGVPIGTWFQNGSIGLEPLSRVPPPVSNPAQPGIKWGAVTDKMSQHRSGQADHRAFLWNMWVFNAWKEKSGIDEPIIDQP